MECKFCSKNNGTEVLLESSSASIYLEKGVFDKHVLIYAVGDSSSTDGYYPKYCPECGRLIKENIMYRNTY